MADENSAQWAPLGRAAEGEETCPTPGCDHHEGITCVRRAGHTGTLVAVDMHLADVGGAPVLFDDDCTAHTPIEAL